MDISSESYEVINNMQIEIAKSSLKNYLARSPKGIDIIVDIGCGTGTITKILSESIKHNKLYAFDIDQSMIDYANVNNKTESIIYSVQDISVSWDDLNSTLKDLEGKADFVFSNFVLHWVEDEKRAVAVNNIYKLLKPESKCHLNIIYSKDIARSMPEELLWPDPCGSPIFKLRNSVESQVEMWKNYFKVLGAKNVEGKWEMKLWKWENKKTLEKILDLMMVYYTKRYMYNYNLLLAMGKEYRTKLKKYIYSAALAKLNQIPEENYDENQKEMEFFLIQIQLNLN